MLLPQHSSAGTCRAAAVSRTVCATNSFLAPAQHTTVRSLVNVDTAHLLQKQQKVWDQFSICPEGNVPRLLSHGGAALAAGPWAVSAMLVRLA